jgi:2-amino-4-hydroxy-6-hydroxymethyldihydropteridine diphosphokinase
LNFDTVTAFIALGANLGDRAASIGAALDLLGDTAGVWVSRVSPLLDNPAVGGPADSPPFLNAVAQIETTLPPEALLDRLLEIESGLGRIRRQRWEPRTIDLDLILYGDVVMKTDRLTIPHPLMHERRFVLAPLSGIAPDLMHPLLKKTVSELLSGIKKD